MAKFEDFVDTGKQLGIEGKELELPIGGYWTKLNDERQKGRECQIYLKEQELRLAEGKLASDGENVSKDYRKPKVKLPQFQVFK
ncbi:hypothetical protein HOLleu_29734 [Holothuria leucospilota]|uniref:Uncharacterized protein n=1 Tax=Holothuria leucospilota TaxID=206669 RepID=A0A9Q1GZK1_HOLLE|nr:hypothetical protein HOLleu_29734 [Holothuria leucospilota]